MKHTDRDATADCPACSGRGGESRIAYNGLGYTEDEEWADCGECEGIGTTSRVHRLAWLIGEARKSEACRTTLTMPVVARTAVMAAV